MGDQCGGRWQDLVRVSHHMFEVADFGCSPSSYRSPINGLVAVHPAAAVVFTGVSSGVVNVAVEVRQAPPVELSLDGWDEVVEVCLDSVVGQVRVVAPMSAPREQPDLPVLTPNGPGHYRIRVHGRGRDTMPDQVAMEPCENYLIIAWPGPPEPDRSYKQTYSYGAMQRESAASRPPDPSEPDTSGRQEQRRTAEVLRRAGRRHQRPGRE
jgi:hypothetical protein